MQQIVDTHLSFNRPWAQFKAGFGTYTGNFWLGLEKIYQMTNSGSYRFRIEVMTTTWKWFSAEYDSFSISPEGSQYTLSISGYSGDTGDVMLDRRNNGVGYLLSMPFSTYDRNNRKNCAVAQGCGWWHNQCSWINPGGPFYFHYLPDLISNPKTYLITCRMMMKRL